ncbi:MAG TPA: hypothetical protein VIL17_01025 [Coriobacteriia bacterium]
MRRFAQSDLAELEGVEELCDLSFDGLRLVGHDFADRVIEDCKMMGLDFRRGDRCEPQWRLAGYGLACALAVLANKHSHRMAKAVR